MTKEDIRVSAPIIRAEDLKYRQLLRDRKCEKIQAERENVRGDKNLFN